MTRLKIDLPERFHFVTEIPIRMRDINSAGHLDASCILTFTTETQQLFLKQAGLSPRDLGGIGVIMADAAIVFKKEAFYGQTITVQLEIEEFIERGCTFFYRLADKATGAEIARVKTSMAFLDYEIRKSVAVPEKFRSIVTSFQPE